MKIALLGDIAFFGRFCLNNNKNLHSQLSDLRLFLSQFDLVIGNLETPFVDNQKPIRGKSAVLKADSVNIDLLAWLGVTHVTLANNHVGDFGKSGYDLTTHLLDKAGIGWFGVENKQLRIEIKGEKLALHGYCSFNTNPSPIGGRKVKGLNYLEPETVLKNINENRRDGYFNIVAVHSGVEHVHMPSSDDVRFARGLAKNGSYIYYGHHPHVIQAHERVSNSEIFYSLGNCLFDDVYTPKDRKEPLIKLSEANKTGAIATLEFRLGEVESAGLTPIYLGDDNILVGEQVINHNISFINSLINKAGTEKYDSNRAATIGAYINKRRKLRNLSWYVSRFNLNSVLIILNARRNARRYSSEFLAKLKIFGSDL
jgi:poly-gamma-glutamate synthesis protein (capsule biosynthesis protein)